MQVRRSMFSLPAWDDSQVLSQESIKKECNMVQFVFRNDIEPRMLDESHDAFSSRLYSALQPGQIAYGWM